MRSGKHFQAEFDLPMCRFYTAANSVYDNTRFASALSGNLLFNFVNVWL